MDQPVVHIVDDDPQVRAATSFLLRSRGYQARIYAHGREFLDCAVLEPGCVLLDLRMPGLSGVQVQEELERRGISYPVIMLSGHGDVPVAVQAMKLGATDFLEKPYGEQKLFKAIDCALAALASDDARARARRAATASLARLSPREHQILRALVGGMSNKAIARRLDLSPRTVEMHRANLMDRLGVASLAEAVRIALDGDLAPLGEGDAC